MKFLKDNKGLVISTGIALVVVIMVLYWDKIQGVAQPALNKIKGGADDTPKNTGVASNADSDPLNYFIIMDRSKENDFVPEVQELQRMMNEMNGYSTPLVEDGYFGPKTEAALGAVTALKFPPARFAMTLMEFRNNIYNKWKVDSE